MLQKWWKASLVYFDHRMLTMLGLGFSSGFPFLLVGATLTLWLKDAGMALKLIGLYSLVKIPYSFKWIWSPIVDRVKLPFFGRLGRRRGWAVFSQVLLLFAILGMASVNPVEHMYALMFFALLTAFASATQDIVLDAYRVESFNNKEQGAASAVFMVGYRVGFIFSGAVALILADFLSWHAVYILMAAGTLIGMITIFYSPEPAEVELPPSPPVKNFAQRIIRFLNRSVAAPLKDFIQRRDWWLILLFVMLYKLCDAYMAPMAMPFYDAMGFTKIEIASVTKIYGMIATIVGGLLGGLMVSRWGIFKSLIIGSILQGLTTLMFVVQAHAGNNIYALMATISLDNLAAGMSTTAFVAYISSLCNIAYTATQYALLSSFMSLLRDLLASTSGWLAEQVSWSTFFTINTLMAIPGLILILIIHYRHYKFLQSHRNPDTLT